MIVYVVFKKWQKYLKEHLNFLNKKSARKGNNLLKTGFTITVKLLKFVYVQIIDSMFDLMMAV